MTNPLKQVRIKVHDSVHTHSTAKVSSSYAEVVLAAVVRTTLSGVVVWHHSTSPAPREKGGSFKPPRVGTSGSRSTPNIVEQGLTIPSVQPFDLALKDWRVTHDMFCGFLLPAYAKKLGESGFNSQQRDTVASFTKYVFWFFVSSICFFIFVGLSDFFIGWPWLECPFGLCKEAKSELAGMTWRAEAAKKNASVADKRAMEAKKAL